MPNQNQSKSDLPIIFYDGECGLCHRFVQFMLSNDTHGVVRFSPLQGETYQQTVYPLKGPPDMTTVMFWDSGTAHTHSDAILHATMRLGGAVGFASRIALWFPRSLRNWTYGIVARNRYRWFGKADACRVPQGKERNRFLP